MSYHTVAIQIGYRPTNIKILLADVDNEINVKRNFYYSHYLARIVSKINETRALRGCVVVRAAIGLSRSSLAAISERSEVNRSRRRLAKRCELQVARCRESGLAGCASGRFWTAREKSLRDSPLATLRGDFTELPVRSNREKAFYLFYIEHATRHEKKRRSPQTFSCVWMDPHALRPRTFRSALGRNYKNLFFCHIMNWNPPTTHTHKFLRFSSLLPSTLVTRFTASRYY